MPEHSDQAAPYRRAATCAWCERDMTTGASCTVRALHRDGQHVRMVRWGKEPGYKASSPCGDCGVLPKGFHHPGCDLQRCPLCRGQMISCGCRFDEDGPEEPEVPIELSLPTVRMADPPGVLLDGPFPDVNGDPTEIRLLDGGLEATIHYVDLPERDLGAVGGIPCTTALRTVIDLAARVDRGQLERMVKDSLERGLFTAEEAAARIAEPDMAGQPGAELLRQVLRG